MRIVSAGIARATIAAHVLGADSEDGALGEITLHPHQRDGLSRVRRLLDLRGGALLADDVGLGKTFIALAIAREARDVAVVAPAAIRDAWLAASTRAGVVVRFIQSRRWDDVAHP